MYATSPRLDADAPELDVEPSLSRSIGLLRSYDTADSEQLELRDRMLRFIDRHPRDAHRRSCLEGHLTASALVIDDRAQRVLLLHHRKLGRWLQLGGHCDGDANLIGVALREAREESGIAELQIVPRIIDVDIHEIPARPGEPAHLHLDTRFLVIAPTATEPRGNHESNALRWVTLTEARAFDLDDSVLRLLNGL